MANVMPSQQAIYETGMNVIALCQFVNFMRASIVKAKSLCYHTESTLWMI